jgi:hypothetical protein
MPQKSSSITKRKAWTVAFYMVADGPEGNANLDKAALNEIALIKKSAAAAGPHVNVAIQVDLKTKPKIRRQIIGRHQHLGPEENAADPAALNGFFEWIQNECPADRNLLIFWGHAEGPIGLFHDGDCRNCEAETLSLLEIRTAFEHAVRLFGRPVDIALFKDCWFGTLEAVYQLAGVVRFAIASPALVVPRYGWPYEEIFRCLRPNGAARDVRVTAKGILAGLGAFYDLARNRQDKIEDADPAEMQKQFDRGQVGHEDVRDEVPFALLNTSAAASLSPTLSKLVAELKKMPRNGASRLALARAARGDPALIDLVLVCKYLAELPDASATLRTHARTLGQVVASDLIVARRPEQSSFGGISTFYFPAAPEDLLNSFIALQTTIDDYLKLKLSSATGWNQIALENVPTQPRQ